MCTAQDLASPVCSADAGSAVLLSSVQDHSPLALSGDSADILLTGIDASALHAGAVLCHPEYPVHLAYKFIVQVLVLQIPVPILKGHAVTIHAHTAREAGVISGLLGLCDSKTGQHRQHKPRCLLSGQVRQMLWW